MSRRWWGGLRKTEKNNEEYNENRYDCEARTHKQRREIEATKEAHFLKDELKEWNMMKYMTVKQNKKQTNTQKGYPSMY